MVLLSIANSSSQHLNFFLSIFNYDCHIMTQIVIVTLSLQYIRVGSENRMTKLKKKNFKTANRNLQMLVNMCQF